MKQEPKFVALKLRIYPTGKQRELLSKTFGCCRLIYNTALAKRIEQYEAGRKTNAMDYIYQLPKMKQKFPWLAEVDSQALQQALRDMDVAYKNFFEGRFNFPKFKKKNTKQSFRSTQGNRFDSNGMLRIGTSGFFKYKGLNNRYDGEKIRNITVSLDKSGRYFASVLIEKDNTVLDHCHEFLRCGIDVGVKQPLTIGWEDNSGNLKAVHTGRAFSAILRTKENRRKRYQRVMSRRKLGSSNWKKAKRHVAKSWAKETDYRKNWVCVQANRLATRFTEIKFEDLKITKMTKSVKKKEDGSARKGAKAKSSLNREILRLGWNLLHIRLQQKAEQYGTKILFVDPKHTSQRCNACGHIEKANRKSQANFKCLCCEFTVNADKNASWNIMQAKAIA